MLFLQVDDNLHATKTKQQTLMCRFFILRALWTPDVSFGSARSLEKQRVKRLKGTRAAAAAEDEAMIQPAGPAATGLSVVNGNKSSHQTGRGSWGQTGRPPPPPVQMSLSVCLFHSFSLGEQHGRAYVYVHPRENGWIYSHF